jgi:hypothetical protein
MKPTDGKAVGRRDFLRSIGVGAVGGTAALVTVPLVGEALAGDETADERRKPRYNANSPDVQAFYRVNHYPATKK